MKRRIAAFAAALALCFGLIVPSAAAEDSVEMPGEGWEVLRLVNQHRMSMGLEPLSVFGSLQKVANLRAHECTIYYSHTRPDGRGCETAVNDEGISWNITAENIAMGQPTPAWVMDDWLNSPGHRANIEDSDEVHLGVGYEMGSWPCWSQNFVGSFGCRISGAGLSQTTVSAQAGQSLEEILTAADIVVTASCARHGSCCLPLIAEMCSGYDPDAAGEQTVTVAYGGSTAELVIVKAGRANPTNDDLTIDGVKVDPTAYKINGSNYFKLRDVAALLNGTEKQFNVEYDDGLKAILITTGQGYDRLPTDLQGTAAGSQTAIPSNNVVYIDGVKTDLTVYKINGNNYFKLRDLGIALDFNVGYGPQGMYIEGDKPYDPAN